MAASEQFCLKWNDFESNISSAFLNLRKEEDFFDVTLACDDDQIKAHKLIIAACSPFFHSILRKNHHQHPLLYLKGIKYNDLVSVINFMYHGEVSVAQDDLNTFLAVAEELQVKGLTQSESQTSNHIKSEKIVTTNTGSNKAIKRSKNLHEDEDINIIEDVSPVKQEPGTVSRYQVATTYEQGTSSNSQEPGVESQRQGRDYYVEGGGNYQVGNRDYQEAVETYDENELTEYQNDSYTLEGGYTSTPTKNHSENKARRESLYQQFLVRGEDCWSCAECQARYKQRVHLIEHIEGKHLPQVKWICPHSCGYFGRSRKNIRYHVGQQHWEQQQQLKLDLGDCDFVIDAHE